MPREVCSSQLSREKRSLRRRLCNRVSSRTQQLLLIALRSKSVDITSAGNPAHDQGFSLIEMVVALVVLSFSLTVLYQAAMGATRNVRVAAEYSDAVILAESMLADNSYITQESFSRAGRFREFDWVVKSWPAGFEDGRSPEERGVAPQALQYLKVEVSWPGKNAPRTLDLLTVVPLRVPVE